jgi:hypothetical protein
MWKQPANAATLRHISMKLTPQFGTSRESSHQSGKECRSFCCVRTCPSIGGTPRIKSFEERVPAFQIKHRSISGRIQRPDARAPTRLPRRRDRGKRFVQKLNVTYFLRVTMLSGLFLSVKALVVGSEAGTTGSAGRYQNGSESVY